MAAAREQENRGCREGRAAMLTFPRRTKGEGRKPPWLSHTGLRPWEQGTNVEMLTDWLLGLGVGGEEQWAGCWRVGWTAQLPSWEHLKS